MYFKTISVPQMKSPLASGSKVSNYCVTRTKINMTSSTRTTPRRWYHWYAPEDTPEERRLILKLDALIVPYAVVVYWLKYIDQTNISTYPISFHLVRPNNQAKNR